MLRLGNNILGELMGQVEPEPDETTTWRSSEDNDDDEEEVDNSVLTFPACSVLNIPLLSLSHDRFQSSEHDFAQFQL